MKYILFYYHVAHDKLGKLSIVVWVAILILTGTYIRIRPPEPNFELEDIVPTADWLVIAQLSTCFLGGVLGILLMRKHTHFGFGAKALLVYLVAVAFSAVFSPYHDTVFGYWVLLAGTSLLTIGLVQRAQTQEALNQIENVWLLTLSLLLLKDTITALLFLGAGVTQSDTEPYRLGMKVTHPNLMGLLSALAFWLSFKKHEVRRLWLLRLSRLLFLLIIALSRSRIAMISLTVGGVVRSWFRYGYQRRQGLYPLLIVIPCCFVATVTFWILALSFELPGTTTVVDFFNRGEDLDTVMSVTGRTEIWPYAIKRIFDGPISLLFGHGYGMSRFVLNEESWGKSFFVKHSHNTLLEILLSTGLLGAVPFIILLIYSTTWLTRFQQLSREFSFGFVLRAIAVVSVVYTSTITESDLGLKIGPITIIYIFYLLALDRRRYLVRPVALVS